MGNGCWCGARGGGGWGNLPARAVSQLAPVPTLESACLMLAAFPPPLTFHVGETRRCSVGEQSAGLPPRLGTLTHWALTCLHRPRG